MNNRIVSMDLYNHLKSSNTSGIVHSIFDKSINLLLEDDIILTLLNDTKDLAPMSAVCDHKTFKSLDLKLGDHIKTRAAKLYLDGELLLDLSDYYRWEKINTSRLTRLNLARRKYLVDILYKRIIEKGNLDGIAAVVYFFDEEVLAYLAGENLEIEKNHYVNFILERLENFICDFKNCEFSKIEESFLKIIGFGPGLTPSVDDFICGFFSASKSLCEFYEINEEYLVKLSESLIEKIHLRTTRISEEMIKHCFKGNISRTYDSLILSLIYESHEDVEDLIDKVIEFGDTSGTDFLAGVYSASRLFEKHTIRRKFDGCKV